MFCARPAASAAAANAFVRFVGVTRMRWPFPFPFHGLFLQILFPFTMPAPPQGNHFALTEQITNFVIFRSFHFISFRCVAFRLVCFGCGQRGHSRSSSSPACLLLFVPVLLLLKSGFLFFFRVGFVLNVAYLLGYAVCVSSSLPVCVCVCVNEIECSIEHLISKNSF